jgi:hypothetical protein
MPGFFVASKAQTQNMTRRKIVQQPKPAPSQCSDWDKLTPKQRHRLRKQELHLLKRFRATAVQARKR